MAREPELPDVIIDAIVALDRGLLHMERRAASQHVDDPHLRHLRAHVNNLLTRFGITVETVAHAPCGRTVQ